MSISNITISDTAFTCRRSEGGDRRKAHFNAAIRSFFSGRRKSLRREGQTTIERYREDERTYSYGMLFGILIFLGLDAVLSLTLVNWLGNVEGSVIQALSQTNGMQTYFLVKSIVASLFIFFAAVYQSVPALKRISPSKILTFMMSVYVTFIVVEIVLIA